jgi:hypothetical protein
VRGTTREERGLAAIEAAGAEAVVADPLRLGTVAVQLEGVSVLAWLMASARGTPEELEALHGPRLDSLLGTLVDTPVRGVVYEAAGSVDAALLEAGAVLTRMASATHRMPARVIEADPVDRSAWLEAALAAVEEVLGE